MGTTKNSKGYWKFDQYLRQSSSGERFTNLTKILFLSRGSVPVPSSARSTSDKMKIKVVWQFICDRTNFGVDMFYSHRSKVIAMANQSAKKE